MSDPADAERRRFRDAMGRFATGVTIVTTLAHGEVHGMTANGFMSVSLDPQLVVVSLGNRSRMRSLLDVGGSYGVNVLGSGQRALSDHFAGRPSDGLAVPFDEVDGVPLIEGALARIAATIVDLHLAGDHTLVIGEVSSFELGDGAPLIFHGGAYAALVDQHEWTAAFKDPELRWY